MTFKAKETALNEFDSFIDALTQNDKVALIFHRDPDGLCSAVITTKALERLKKLKLSVVLPLEYHELERDLIEKLKAKGIEKIISLDLGLDNWPHIVKELEGFAFNLILDHHKIYANLSSEKTVFIKAQFLSDIDGSKYPATKLCFDLFSRHTNIDDLSWIAVIGIHGDFGLNQWRSLSEKAFSDFNFSEKELEVMTESINAFETIKPKDFSKLYDAFLSFKKPKDFLDSKFIKLRERLYNEVNIHLNEFKKKAEFYDDLQLIFYFYKAKNNIKSFLANKLSLLYPNKTIILIQDLEQKKLMLSARRQDFKVKMNDLLEYAVKGIPNASAGGHIPAAAGSIPKDKLNEFKAKLIEAQRKALMNN